MFTIWGISIWPKNAYGNIEMNLLVWARAEGSEDGVWVRGGGEGVGGGSGDGDWAWRGGWGEGGKGRIGGRDGFIIFKQFMCHLYLIYIYIYNLYVLFVVAQIR